MAKKTAKPAAPKKRAAPAKKLVKSPPIKPKHAATPAPGEASPVPSGTATRMKKVAPPKTARV